MIKFNKYIICLLTTILLFSCETNKKLKQQDAEKAIKEFVSKNSFNGNGSWGQEGSFDINTIASIEPISQFSEDEASAITHFNFQDSFAGVKLILKFNFKRNVDKQWYLTKIDAVAGVGSEPMSIKVGRDWQNINILVQ